MGSNEGITGGQIFHEAAQTGDARDTSALRHTENIGPADVVQGPTDLGQGLASHGGSRSSFCHLGEMGPLDVMQGLASIGGATSAFCRVGEIWPSAFCHVGEVEPADIGHRLTKIGGAISAFYHVGEMEPEDLGQGPTRHRTFVGDPGHATSARTAPSPERHEGTFAEITKILQVINKSLRSTEIAFSKPNFAKERLKNAKKKG